MSARKSGPRFAQALLEGAARRGENWRIREIFTGYPDLDPDLPVEDNIVPALLRAVFCRDLDLARYMLSIGAHVDGPVYENGETPRLTPLMAAVLPRPETSAFVALLLEEHHASVAITTEQGDTVLHRALDMHAAPEIIRKLVAAGCDPFQANKFGTTALHTGARIGHLEGVRTLLQLTRGETVPNPLTGLTPIEELQTADFGTLHVEGRLNKEAMLQLLHDYPLQKLLAAAKSGTQRPLPALPKLGRTS